MNTTEKLIAYRTKGGHNETDSRALLADLLSKHSQKTLAAALYYCGFCAQRMADSLANSLIA